MAPYDARNDWSWKHTAMVDDDPIELDAHDAAAELRSFGRRRGRKASDRQRTLMETLLPLVRIDPAGIAAGPQQALGHLFGQQPRDVWLEIGFGGGEHLVWQARANPQVGFIGAEPFEDGVVKVLDQIDTDKLTNIRLLADDVRPLLRALPADSIDRAFILFPDPWPKRRHVKRRLVSAHLLDLLARVMKPGAELRIGTDIGDYARTMLIAFQGEPRFEWQAASPEDWRIRPHDWPQTRYEAKAEREGRRRYYLRFRRTG